MNSKVSVILPVYNVEKYLRKCLDSILKQSYKNFEIILINDGSQDNSKKICEEYNKKYSNIKLINHENSGVSSSRNKGLDASTGDYIVFIDSDDYISEDFLEYMLRLISLDEDCDMAFSINCFKNKNDIQVEDEVKIIDSISACKLFLSSTVDVGCWNKIFKKSIFDDLRFNENLFYGEGLEFIIKSALKSKRISVGKKKVYFYRKNNINSAMTKFNIKKHKNGELSLANIKNIIPKFDNELLTILNKHICIFYFNILIDIINNNAIKDNKDYYMNTKRKLFSFIFIKNLPFLYRIKSLFIILIPKLFCLKSKINRLNNIKYSID